MAHCVEVDSLSKHYRDFLLDAVSFVVPEGTVMGLVGENGAGKSTVIRLILGAIKRDAGKVKLFGTEWETRVPNAIKDQIGVVFDDCYFPVSLSPNQLGWTLGSIYRQWDPMLFGQLLSRFDVPGDKKIKELSRGNKMKLSIVCALSHRPKLLVLDEPTGGLDPVVRTEVLDMFQTFMEDERHSIIFSSHITTDLERIADYVTFIHKGKIILSETKDDLLDRYGLFKGPRDQIEHIEKGDFVSVRVNRYGLEALSSDKEHTMRTYPQLICDQASIDDILYHLTSDQSRTREDVAL
ncbi:MAG: ABC transporter ATP-binding protein [Sphaerochaetaceae bacterium]|nr:ABC transporter ATP-binding protein [Sphaerochaetaceae bacterium]